METFDPSKPFDLKEAFNYLHHIRPEMKHKLPNTFLQSLKDFFDQCHNLTLILFKLLTTSLDVKDPEYFPKAHQRIGFLGNTTALRSLYYPAVDASDILPQQSRCAEHTDYGTLTLLFPNAEGLEVFLMILRTTGCPVTKFIVFFSIRNFRDKTFFWIFCIP